MDGNDSVDPKQSTGDMAAFVQNLLQQMVGFFPCSWPRFESVFSLGFYLLEERSRGRVAEICFTCPCSSSPTKAKMKQFHLNGMYIRYSQENKILHPICKWFLDILNFNALDEMGSRIDELEQSINDLRAEMGAENSPSPSVPAVPKDDSKSPSEV
ncbi:hypothetical protein QUC31_016229 [Theobroma cacao]